MDRPAVIVPLLVVLLAAPLAVEAQLGAKVYRIGELREGEMPLSATLPEALRALGWVEGRNLQFERRQADRRDQLPALAAELVRLKVDLIVTAGTPATRAAKAATSSIPIVFSLAGDPVERELVASLARPGGNLTGFTLGVYDEKLLEVLHDALPAVSRVAYANATREPRPGLQTAGRALGVEVKGIVVSGPGDFERFFAEARRAGAGAVVVPNVAWFRPHLARIGAAAAKSRLPSIGSAREFAESGGLLAYGPIPGQNVPRIADQIDRILRGARPSDLPVEQATKLELVVNQKTAKALGLTVPPAMLLRADRVIE